jgi:hypothetical protein
VPLRPHETPSQSLRVVTVNWGGPSIGLTDEAPFGNTRFVVFRKGGEGNMFFRAEDATSTNVFPSSSSEPGGTKYSYETIK